MARPPFQARQSVIIDAPLQTVWDFNQDLSKIADYHPRVKKVDLVSGTSRRQAGAAYKCHMKDGKNSCVERDIEVIPLQKIVTVMSEDTLGICKVFTDYVVETVFTSLGENSTKIEFCHYYSTRSLTAKSLNFMAKSNIAHESQATLEAIKCAVEKVSK
jgi:hypothetical protein